MELNIIVHIPKTINSNEALKIKGLTIQSINESNSYANKFFLRIDSMEAYHKLNELNFIIEAVNDKSIKELQDELKRVKESMREELQMLEAIYQVNIVDFQFSKNLKIGLVDDVSIDFNVKIK